MRFWQKLREWAGKRHTHDPSGPQLEPQPKAVEHREEKEHREDKAWKRTTGYRNFMNRLAWLPVIKETSGGTIAELKSGRQYLIRKTGWIRLREKAKAKETTE